MLKQVCVHNAFASCLGEMPLWLTAYAIKRTSNACVMGLSWVSCAIEDPDVGLGHVFRYMGLSPPLRTSQIFVHLNRLACRICCGITLIHLHCMCQKFVVGMCTIGRVLAPPNPTCGFRNLHTTSLDEHSQVLFCNQMTIEKFTKLLQIYSCRYHLSITMQ